MAGRWRAEAFALVAVAGLLAAPARAADPDPWLGADKWQHFGVSSALAAGGYGVGAAYGWSTGGRLMLGGGVALAAGVGKELWDLGGGGTASWRDLTWDVAGTATGLMTAWLVDAAVQRWLLGAP